MGKICRKMGPVIGRKTYLIKDLVVTLQREDKMAVVNQKIVEVK